MTARQELDGFLAKYTPEIARFARAILKKMRTRLPGALELVYDNYNALAIGFSPTESSSDTIFSIAVYPRWVTLFFMRGAGLPDPDKILKGSGKVVRHVVIKDLEMLDSQPIEKLVRTALEAAPLTIDSSQKNRLIIKSISARQRPRRPA